MKPHTVTLSASALAALALTACSGRVLDYRNMTVSGGKIYSQNSDTPFSGKVTNVPFRGFIQTDGPFSLIYNLAGTMGKTMEGYDNENNAVCDFSVRDGYRDGDAICRDPRNGIKYYEFSFKGGRMVGDAKAYSADSNNKPIVTGTITDQGLDGTVKAYSANNHTLTYKGEFKNGVFQSSEEYYPDTGNLKKTYIPRVGHSQGLGVMYSQDGKRIAYSDGAKGDKRGTPVYLFYPTTGKLKKCSIGNDSLSLNWDEDGNLINALSQNSLDTFKETLADTAALCKENTPPNTPDTNTAMKSLDDFFGKNTRQSNTPVDTLSTPEGIVAAINGEDRTDWPKEDNACTQAWANAFRKESGADAVIRYDMAWEWVDNCRAGKRPH